MFCVAGRCGGHELPEDVPALRQVVTWRYRCGWSCSVSMIVRGH
ncbi:hypothetical protein BSU04_44235 [Caballeronia sordidicola]|uniref:Uncharacterized protein n=1 Tax=Caballeronia sordidicola TaxID=196367 RepID=A0A226WLD7_CABSO|nr:hypothetical protein BSU04_44235 [Caballeronia sordidicola]